MDRQRKEKRQNIEELRQNFRTRGSEEQRRQELFGAKVGYSDRGHTYLFD